MYSMSHPPSICCSLPPSSVSPVVTERFSKKEKKKSEKLLQDREKSRLFRDNVVFRKWSSSWVFLKAFYGNFEGEKKSLFHDKKCCTNRGILLPRCQKIFFIPLTLLRRHFGFATKRGGKSAILFLSFFCHRVSRSGNGYFSSFSSSFLFPIRFIAGFVFVN